jgi:hypothetical protein
MAIDKINKNLIVFVYLNWYFAYNIVYSTKVFKLEITLAVDF